MLEKDYLEVQRIYDVYDAGGSEDKDAFEEIRELLREQYNSEEVDKVINACYKNYNAGGSGADMLMDIMDLVEKIR